MEKQLAVPLAELREQTRQARQKARGLRQMARETIYAARGMRAAVVWDRLLSRLLSRSTS